MTAEFWKDCPRVQVDPYKMHGSPTVGAYRLAAQTVVECEELGDAPEEIAADYGVPLEDVRAILGYYHAREPQLMPSR
jgi:uncharacterized protein (DUF433 family)